MKGKKKHPREHHSNLKCSASSIILTKTLENSIFEMKEKNGCHKIVRHNQKKKHGQENVRKCGQKIFTNASVAISSSCPKWLMPRRFFLPIS